MDEWVGVMTKKKKKKPTQQRQITNGEKRREKNKNYKLGLEVV